MKKNEILGTTAENLGKSVYLSVTDSVLEEIAKAIPIVSVLKAGCSAYQNIGVKRREAQFFIFVEECERIEEGAILKIYKDKNNIEMGMEILNAIEESYLKLHAKMIAKLAILYDKKRIERIKFLKYIHIIPKLTSYLLEQIKDSYDQYQIVKTEFQGKKSLGAERSKLLSYELVSLGFLEATSVMGGGFHYSGTEDLDFFYENIYKEE
ncbi:hypothetical protein FW754_15480 [Acinetobacter sp. 1207_04]|uniref:hypothetical protein n=1 Tax=Acinetobacter sp. 1207_04 TaxID=2604449 RepID=UPI004059DF62